MRVGQGYDVHRLVPGCDLILGGVKIDYSLGLAGHSDADVLTHALIDALLGAGGLGDIGTKFPDTDEEYRGISSLLLLEKTAFYLRLRGYLTINIDATIVAQQPKLRPYIRQMERKLAAALGIRPERVNVKASTEEGLGFTGAGEGIAAHAVALIESIGGYRL